MITGITYLGFGILTLIAQYFLFQKMGMPGWKGLIPIYSSYLLFKELLSTRHFAAYAVSLVASSVILALILLIQVLHRLSRSFGHGAGFTFGLVVIEPIMMMILGFGSRQYEKVVA